MANRIFDTQASGANRILETQVATTVVVVPGAVTPALQTFNFPFHTFETEYPDSGFRVQLGNSYQFTAPPTAPDQRIFKLGFPFLKYYVVAGVISHSVSPQNNLAILEDFYNFHKTHKTFIYPHPVYGNLNCKFSKPLKIPKGMFDGGGAVANIELELTEMP